MTDLILDWKMEGDGIWDDEKEWWFYIRYFNSIQVQIRVLFFKQVIFCRLYKKHTPWLPITCRMILVEPCDSFFSFQDIFNESLLFYGTNDDT